MTTDVATVSPGSTLKDVAAILVQRRISGVPVVDDDGRVLGVVSEADFLARERGEVHVKRRGLARLLGDSEQDSEKLSAQTAGEAMTSPALTIEGRRTVAEAAGLMIEHAVNRLPVLAEGKLVGIVSRADLVRAFTRSDEEIRREIEDEVLLGTFAIPPENHHVTVHEGEVSLGGEVETDSVRDLLVAFVARVPGVVSVQSRLNVREDYTLPRPERSRP